MNYVITGSLGHISKPVIQRLLSAGHSVSVITRKPRKRKSIKALGAKVMVGFVEDDERIKRIFSQADAVYLMIPLGYPSEKNWHTYQEEVTDSYVNALRATGVKNAIFLSSIGSHLGKGTSHINGLGYTEWHLSQIEGLNLKILRPSYLYKNLMSMIPLIKHTNIFGANFGSKKEKLVLTHTKDIVDVVAEELLGLKFRGKSIRYVASDERHVSEIAEVLGKAIGKPFAPWIEFKDDDSFRGMVQSGIRHETAKGIVGLGMGLRDGTLQADYWKCRPRLGKVKLERFAKEFAVAYETTFSADKYF